MPSLGDESAKKRADAERAISRLLRDKPRVATFTPEMFEVLLETAAWNRPISQTTVRKYSEALREGRWYSDAGQAVSFDSAQRYCSGFHRAHASIQTGLPLTTNVLYDQNADHVVLAGDKGRKWSTADSISDLPNSKAVSACASLVMRVERSRPGQKPYGYVGMPGDEVLAEYVRSQFDRFDEAVNESRACYMGTRRPGYPSQRLIPHGVLSGFYALVLTRDLPLVKELYRELPVVSSPTLMAESEISPSPLTAQLYEKIAISRGEMAAKYERQSATTLAWLFDWLITKKDPRPRRRIRFWSDDQPYPTIRYFVLEGEA